MQEGEDTHCYIQAQAVTQVHCISGVVRTPRQPGQASRPIGLISLALSRRIGLRNHLLTI